MFCEYGIAPHLFEPIEAAAIGMHDVNHHIHIIDEHPLQLLLAFLMKRTFVAIVFYLVDNIIGNGPDLGGIARFANNKEVGNGLVDLSQIERYDLLSLFLTDGSDYGLDNLGALCKSLYRLFSSGRRPVLAAGQ